MQILGHTFTFKRVLEKWHGYCSRWESSLLTINAHFSPKLFLNQEIKLKIVPILCDLVTDTAHNAVGGVLFGLSSLIFNLSQYFLMCTFTHREEVIYSSNQGIIILKLREPQAPRYFVLVPISKTNSKTMLKKNKHQTPKPTKPPQLLKY